MCAAFRKLPVANPTFAVGKVAKRATGPIKLDLMRLTWHKARERRSYGGTLFRILPTTVMSIQRE
ncbi:MAG TPA: hypothetical protein VMT53_27290 [Terriglobales bacterium]|nr:hypothetical protein [Terriglobales bacterium]